MSSANRRTFLSWGLLGPLLSIGLEAVADEPAKIKMKQFLYVLQLVPRLHTQSAWTDADSKAVDDHFARLKLDTAAGRVILAGRTAEPLDKTFGLVIFEAPDEEAARKYMESDPAVVAGVMTATLHPYSVALMRPASGQ